MAKTRAPICVCMGHVDHGKTTILDHLRGTKIASGEAGGITQSISSTNFSIDFIKKFCGDLLKKLNLNLTLPGILFIDSPGHAAFTNLRKRGGNLADIAILVIDINEGIKPQTLECIDILKQYKTPFIIAVNKIDLISGWQEKDKLILKNIESQSEGVKYAFETKFYEIVGKLAELGFDSDRFDRVDDFTKQIALVPISAKKDQGLVELLMVLTGLAQKFLDKCLECNVDGPAKGTILEVKEEKGLGKTLDVIIYDGCLKKNDIIVIGSLEKPLVTKVKALFEPQSGAKGFNSVSEVHAATGVKVSATDIDDVVPGMPLMVAYDDTLEKVKETIQAEVEEVIIEEDMEGIVVKADSLGSLEALIGLLRENGIMIKKASIGDISKKDIAEASAEKENLNKVILGFNVKGFDTNEVKVIVHPIIYSLIDDLKKWRDEQSRLLEEKNLEDLVRPAKIKIMKGYVFRQSNPAVVGVEVLGGTLKKGVDLINEEGAKCGEIKTIQIDGENVQEAKKGVQVAVAILGVVVGRQIHEDETLYVDVPEDNFIRFKKLKKYLNESEIQVLRELAEIKRRDNSVWGV